MTAVVLGVKGVSSDGVSTAPPVVPAALSGTGLGDRLFLIAGYGNSVGAAPATPAGWTFLDSVYGVTGSFGSETGPRGLAVWYCDDDGTMAGDVVTLTNGGSGTTRVLRAVIHRLVLDNATAWSTPASEVFEDSTSNTTFSGTFSPDPGALTGDYVIAAACWVPSTSNVSTGITAAVGWTGTTGTTELLDSGTSTNGNKLRFNTYGRPVSTGTSSAAPTLSLTLGAAATGVGLLIRQRATGVPLGADAGVDQAVEPYTTVTLDGSESTGAITAYAWTQTAGTVVTLSSASAQQPTFEAPASLDGETLTFELTVTDGSSTSSASVTDVDVLPAVSRRAKSGAWHPLRRRRIS